MACVCNKVSGPKQWVTCMGFQVYETDDALVMSYANRTGAPNSGPGCGPLKLTPLTHAAAMIYAHRLIYAKDSPGDCPKTSNVGSGTTTALKITSLTGGVTGIASTVGGIAQGGLSGATIGLSGALGTVLGVASLGAGLIALPLSIIARHNKMVALEEGNLCAVAQGYNEFAEQVESALKAGAITLEDAKTLAGQAEKQLVSALQKFYKNCNGYCWFIYAIKGVTLFAQEQLYPRIAPSRRISPTTASAQPTPTTNAVSPRAPLLAAAGIAALKILGFLG